MRSNTLMKIAIVLAIVAGTSATARADVSECVATWGLSSGIHMERVTYFGPFNSNEDDPRADADDPSHTVLLKGSSINGRRRSHKERSGAHLQSWAPPVSQ